VRSTAPGGAARALAPAARGRPADAVEAAPQALDAGVFAPVFRGAGQPLLEAPALGVVDTGAAQADEPGGGFLGQRLGFGGG
jgi:hypothetical protein